MESFNKIFEYIPAFEKKLNEIEINHLSADPFRKKYLNHLLQHKKYYLKIYASALELLLKNAGKNKEKIILIDYGAGNGLLGLFAKFCGFHKVYLNDISKSFTDAGEELSIALDIPLDGIITGDITAVANYFKMEKPTAIVGTDVIEHIYDLHSFFKEISNINSNMVSVFTTASNPDNKFKLRKLKQLQVKDEYQGGRPDDYFSFGEEPVAPFIKTREQMIRKNFSTLADSDVLQLSSLTRGLIERDIISTVQKFIDHKILPIALPHPTNTCDPVSGSWTERILTLEEYKEIYLDSGFNLKICNGFYNEYSGISKRLLLKAANLFIKISGSLIAPFISLVGTPVSK